MKWARASIIHVVVILLTWSCHGHERAEFDGHLMMSSHNAKPHPARMVGDVPPRS